MNLRGSVVEGGGDAIDRGRDNCRWSPPEIATCGHCPAGKEGAMLYSAARRAGLSRRSGSPSIFNNPRETHAPQSRYGHR
jgi:hypothetical protein